MNPIWITASYSWLLNTAHFSCLLCSLFPFFIHCFSGSCYQQHPHPLKFAFLFNFQHLTDLWVWNKYEISLPRPRQTKTTGRQPTMCEAELVWQSLDNDDVDCGLVMVARWSILTDRCWNHEAKQEGRPADFTPSLFLSQIFFMDLNLQKYCTTVGNHVHLYRFNE